MNRPTKKAPLPEMFFWADIEDYYNATHDDDFRTVSRQPYRDFWHWIIEQFDPVRATTCFMFKGAKAPDWAESRYRWLMDEFGENGELVVWIDW